MKKRTFISLILVICLLTSCFGLYPAADDNSQMPSAIQVTDTVSDISEIIPVSLQELYKQDCIDSLSDSILFDYIDRTLLEKSEVVARLDAFEDLNTYVFLNYDGTQTVYFLNDNVKYIDKDGNVIEKDLSLVKTYNGYRTKQNDVGLFMPEDLSDGIVLSFGDRNICIKPVDYKAGKASVSGNTLIYSDIRYTPTIDGVKEEIVLSTRPEDGTVYSFFIDSGGMKLYEDESGLYLADNEDGEERFVIGNIFMYDSLLRFSEGTVTAEEYEDGYILTVIPDYEFLVEASYPVIIDPSIDFSDNTHGSNAIQDAPVFSGRPNGNAGNYLYNRVGAGNDDYAIGRTAVRLQSLITNSYYTSATASNISSVTFYIKDASGSSATTLKLYALANTTWTETGVTWNNIGTIGSTVYGTNTGLSYGNWTSFDITDLVKAWKNGTANANAGFIIKGADEVTVKDKSFISSEYTSDTSARPYVRFIYSAATLSLSSYTLDLAEGETNQLTAITYPPSASITWASLNTTYATVSNTGLVTGIKAGTTSVCAFDGTNLAVCTVRVHVPDGIYHIKNVYSNLYMTTDNCILDHTGIYQASLRSDDLLQQWRVYHIGCGYETIRPVFKPNMAVTRTYDNQNRWYNADIYDAGEIDEYPLMNGTSYWKIEYEESGYTIKYGGSTGYHIQPLYGVNAVNVILTVTNNTSGSYICWLFENVSNIHYGIDLYNTDTGLHSFNNPEKYIAPEETLNLHQMSVEVAVRNGMDIDQSYDLTSGDTDICTVDNTDGSITGVAPGHTYIVISRRLNGTLYQQAFDIYVTAIPNGIYFIQNRETNKYMQIDDDEGPGYSATGAIMEQRSFSGNDWQRWQITRVYEDCYKIISVKSNKALTVPSNHLGDEDYSLCQVEYSFGTNQIWSITLTSHGSYKIKAKSAEEYSTDLVMAVGTSLIEDLDGVNIEQREYLDNTSYKDEWWIEKLGSFVVNFLGINNSGHDHTGALITVRTNLHNSGFNNIRLTSGSVGATGCKNILLYSNLFSSRSHGQCVFSFDASSLLATGIVLDDDDDGAVFYSHFLWYA